MPRLALVTAWILASAALLAQEGTVHVREGRLMLTGYDEAAPDPNPPFSLFAHDYFPNYPYTIRGTPANQFGHPEQYRSVILENEYLSCRVLPDLGGHIHGCTDKITGREVFYANPAVRRGPEDSRQAFIAMGIGSSFPIAHSRTGSSPVDFAWSDRGGIGRVVVETTDRVSGMEWRIEYILRPGSAVLEQRVTLHNASAARRGYHWWANAAVEVDDPHLHFVYPVKWMLPHGSGPMTSWPLNAQGIDLSDIANDQPDLGLFGHGSREPWMAVYKPALRNGVAHYADAAEVRGKKLWLWGTNDYYVKDSLTNPDFNSYVEMQAGLFETQLEFAFLQPRETKTFSHYWIPFHDLGGVSRATRDAVLNLSRVGAGVTVEVDPTHRMPGTHVRLLSGEKVLFESSVDLDPKEIYKKTLDAAPAPLTVDIADAAGTVVIHHVEGQIDAIPFDPSAKNPEPVTPSSDGSSESAVLTCATSNEQGDSFAFAWNDYQSGAAKFPASVPIAVGAGRVAFILHRFDDAIRLLAPVAANDAEGAYYYGAALAAGGRAADARSALAIAARDPHWKRAAELHLVLLAGDDALREIQPLAADPQAAAATGALEVALLRRAGKAAAAAERLRFWREQDPANNLLRVENVLLGGEDPALSSHLGADAVRVLDVVDVYFALGAFDDALKLLDRRYPAVPPSEAEPGALAPQDNPLVAYYRGYCRMKLGQDPAADFKAAAALSTLYVFPHRASSFPVLKAALARNESDAVAHDLLGDLYFDSLESGPAITEWRKALALKADLPALHRNLGRALLDVNKDPASALPVLLEGRRLDPENRDIADALNRLRTAMPGAARSGDTALLPEAAARFGDHLLVRSVLDPDGALGVLTSGAFSREKQPDAVRRAYIEAQLQQLLARAHAGKCSEALNGLEKLGDEDKGVPFTMYGFGSLIKAPHFQFYMGVVESTCLEDKASRKRWAKISKASEAVDSPDYVFPCLASLKLRDKDAQQKAAGAIQAVRARTDLAFAQGMLQLAAGQAEEGATLLQKSAKSPDPLIQYLALLALRESGSAGH
ncbi:MAG: DUF5107 domain-containing protein [Bryobacteraceae bacterium]|jgi:tetratricopeptide (TPR) repeat protein